MADLEDTILKQNVPGRWSTHNEYDKCDKHRIERDADDYDAPPDDGCAEPTSAVDELKNTARDLSNAEVPEPIRRQILNHRMQQHQTGVKGVLADYRAEKKMAHAQRQAEAEQRSRVINRMVHGAVRVEAKEQAEEAVAEAAGGQEEEEGDSDGLDEDDDDDEFFAAFRRKRLEDLRQGAVTVPVVPSFGSVLEIGASSFLSEVCETSPLVPVVVHLYNNNVLSCQLMNRHLTSIAEAMPAVKFVKMLVSDMPTHGTAGHAHDDYLSTIVNIDREALPMLILYRGGDVEHTLVGAEHGFGDSGGSCASFLKEDIQCLLEAAVAGELTGGTSSS